MAGFDKAEDFITGVETARGELLDPHEREEIALWMRGKELQSVVNTPAWEIVLATMQSYADASVETLLSLKPGDERVAAAHAAASALVQQNAYFRQDVQNAVQASFKIPEAMKQTLREAQQI